MGYGYAGNREPAEDLKSDALAWRLKDNRRDIAAAEARLADLEAQVAALDDDLLAMRLGDVMDRQEMGRRLKRVGKSEVEGIGQLVWRVIEAQDGPTVELASKGRVTAYALDYELDKLPRAGTSPLPVAEAATDEGDDEDFNPENLVEIPHSDDDPAEWPDDAVVEAVEPTPAA